MEFDDHDEQDNDDIHTIPASPPPYHSLPISKLTVSAAADGVSSAVTPGRKPDSTVAARYRECQKNHAVSLGAHAVDGCGEFIPAGEEGTLDALKCAACNCHRNFHRKETDGGEITPFQPPPPPPPPHHYQYHHQQYPPYYRGQPPPPGYLHHPLSAQPMALHRSLALPAPASIRDEEDMSNPSSSGGGGSGGGGKKRFRTKFTAEQKEKMLEFAERVGWRIQKHDEGAVEQFCAENCLKRHVLKVWMHNNKNTLGGKKP